MKQFLQRFGSLVLGFLCGFDRIRFRGTKIQLCYPNGILGFLASRKIRGCDFKAHALQVTEQLFQAIEPPAKRAGIYRYLNSGHVSLEQVALEIAAEQKRTNGLVAVIGRVEPCQTIEMHRGENGWPVPHLKSGAKCLHYYHYYLDPEYGLRYTRLQSWFPFTMHVGLNGRDWLACQMKRAGIGFTQEENCFTWVEDFEAAQGLLDDQLKTDWVELLSTWARESNPLEPLFLGRPVPYYWSVQEGEYATDIMFRSPEDLRNHYPLWVHQAYATMQSGDLLRYLNYKVNKDGQPGGARSTEVKTTVKEFVSGTCVRHRVEGNLLKMYDKMGSVLRIETMLRDVTHFRVYRTDSTKEQKPRIMRLRKGVADMHRRAQVSEKINDRYANALATVEAKESLAELTEELGESVEWRGRSARGLNPLSERDMALLEAVNRGAFLIAGFRNRDVREILFPAEPIDEVERKQQSVKVTRLLQLLRAHKLITKIPKTHRYQVSDQGRAKIAVMLAARAANTKKLLQAA